MAVVVGAFGMSLSEGGRLRLAQLLFLFVGLGLGAWMACTPRRILLYEGPLAGWLAVVAVALAATLGSSLGGASRWLAIGPLMIQMSVLAAPFVLLGLTSLVARGRARHALALGLAAQAAFVATADAVASLTLGGVAVIVCAVVAKRWRLTMMMGAIAVAGLAIAAILDPMLAPVAHSEGILGLFTAVSPALTVLGLVALLIAIAAPLLLLRRASLDAPTRGLALAVALSLAIPAAATTVVATVVPLLGYSGSTVVAAYLGIGALISLSRQAPPAVAPDPVRAEAAPQSGTTTITPKFGSAFVRQPEPCTYG